MAKTVFMCSSIEPNRHSGVGNVEYELIHGLRSRGIGVKEFFPAPLKTTALTDFYYGLRLQGRARGAGCDVIHCHTDMSWNTEGAFRTFHGCTALGEHFYKQERPHALMPRHKQAVYFAAHKLFEKKCGRKNYCLAVSDYVRNALVKYYGAEPERCTTVYNGIDAGFFKPDGKAGSSFRKQHGIDESAFVLTWVGHAEFNKGIHYLIELMNAVAADKKMKDAVFVLRTPASEKQLLEKGLDGQALKKVVLAKTQPDLRGFYNAADVHILTSVYEPFCLTLLEAMACGKPVVASDSGGHSEIIPEKAGFLTPVRDVPAMKRAVAELKESGRGRKKMGGEARKTVLKGFTVKHMTENTLEAYRKWR